jgi:WD40 repeat protein
MTRISESRRVAALSADTWSRVCCRTAGPGVTTPGERPNGAAAMGSRGVPPVPIARKIWHDRPAVDDLAPLETRVPIMAARQSEREAALSGLLVDAFDGDPDGLRQWVRLHLGQSIAHELPDGLALTKLAFQVVLVAQRHGRVDQSFFDHLRDARRGLEARIGAIAAEWRAPASEAPPGSGHYRCMATRPEVFIERRQLGALVELLSDAAAHPAGQASVGITTALRGAGGFGKTTLARALCFDARVRAAFPDGILWVTLGAHLRADTLLGRVLGLLRTWTGEEPPAIDDVTDAGFALRERLAGQRVLLVVDDVWRRDHLAPFLGAGAAMLVTTRNHDTLPPTCRAMDVDAMDASESIALLGRDLGLSSDDPALHALAARLGRWPLLLGLASGRLRDLVTRRGLDARVALARVFDQLARKGQMAFDERNTQERDQAVRLTVEVSLEALSDRELQCYERLAIFPEDAAIPIAMLAPLWQPGAPDVLEAEELCERLHDLSLVQHLDLVSGTVRLHDVFRQYLIDRLGDALPALHAEWLAVFLPGSGLWPDLPVDQPHAWRQLAWHLHHAGQQDELVALLFDLDWLDAKLRAVGVTELLIDFELVPARHEARREAHLVRDALGLSSHVLRGDPTQLPSQMLGRLGHLDGAGAPRIAHLLARIRGFEGRAWLQPVAPSLTPPGGPLLRTLTGHSRRVNAVAVSADGKRAISASADWTLKVWDLDTGIELRTLRRHSDWVLAVAVSGDGKRAVSASRDHTLAVWDLERGVLLRQLVGHTSSVNAVAVTADGRRAVSASSDRTVKLWAVEDGVALRTLAGHRGAVQAVAVTPDGKRAISASDDMTLKLWDLDTGSELCTFTGHGDVVGAVGMTADGKRAVSGSRDRTLKLWNLRAGTELATLSGHEATVTAVAITADGKRAISASWDRSLRIWDLATGSSSCLLAGHSVTAVAVTASGQRAISASDDRTLEIWHLDTSTEARTRSGHSDVLSSLALTGDGQRAVSGSWDRTLKVWDLRTVAELHTLTGHSDVVTAVAVTADGRRALSASRDGTVKLWDLATGVVLCTLSGHSDWVTAVAVTADGRRALSASDDKTVKIWDLDTCRELRTMTGHASWVTAVAFVADGSRALSASWDKTLKIWDLDTGVELGTLSGHAHGVRAVAVMRNGKRAISASWDETLRVWDLARGAELCALGLSSAANAVALTADGRRAICALDDRTLQVWDLAHGRALATFTGEGVMAACAVAHADSVMVGGDASGRIHVLRLIEPDPLRPGAPENA